MDFTWADSQRLRQNVVVKAALQGRFARPPLKTLLKDELQCVAATRSLASADLRICAQLVSLAKPISLPVVFSSTSTANSHSNSNSNSHNNSEWVEFQDCKYADLPLDAAVAFSIYTPVVPRVPSLAGSCVIPLFGKYNTLRKGKFKAYVWQGVSPDPSLPPCNPDLPLAFAELNRIDRVSLLLVVSLIVLFAL